MDFRISELETRGMTDAEIAWAVVEPLWNAIDFPLNSKQTQETLSSATEGERMLLAVDWCQKEIRNGGFEQFLKNSTGLFGKQALNGFCQIGAGPYAFLLEEAYSIFPSAEPPLSRSSRIKYLQSVPKPKRDELFSRLEAQFYRLLGSSETDLEKFRGRYIRNNPGQFFV